MQPRIQVVDRGGNAVRVERGGEILAMLLENPLSPVNKSSLLAFQSQWTVALEDSGATFSGIKAPIAGAFVLKFQHRKPDLAGSKWADTLSLPHLVSPVFYVSSGISSLKVLVHAEGDFFYPQSGVELMQQVADADNCLVLLSCSAEALRCGQVSSVDI